MTSWNEYYDDFNSKIRQYASKLVLTEQDFMRRAAEGLRHAQHSTNLVTNTKTISGTDGITFDLDTTAEGNDVLIIINAVDPYGTEIVSQSITQNQDTIELSVLGFNEVPHRASRGKVGTTIGDIPGYEARIYTRIGNVIKINPALATTDVIRINYIMDFHRYTPGSPQWAAFFTNFSAQFQLAPPDSWQCLDECWLCYAIKEFMLEVGSQTYPVWENKYKSALDLALSNKQQHFTEGATPYTVTPYGY